MAKVLIVDDEPSILSLLTAIVSSVPEYKIVSAGSSREGLEKARDEKPDIILLDNKMPGMSGLEVCHIIKSDPVLAPIRILMLSCQGQNFDWQKAKESGADSYITKPFDNEALLDRVKTLLING